MSGHTSKLLTLRLDEHRRLVHLETCAYAEDLAGIHSTADAVEWARDSANGRRLVAAWNACQNIPTDFLERLPPGALADAVEQILQMGRGGGE